MRIDTQLKMRRFVSDSDDAIKEVRISTHDAREHVTSLVASSSWAPEDSLLKHEFEAILKLKPRGEHAGPAAADKARHLTGEHHPRPVGGRTRRALGLLGPDRGGQASVQLRVRSGDVSVLREATEDRKMASSMSMDLALEPLPQGLEKTSCWARALSPSTPAGMKALTMTRPASPRKRHLCNAGSQPLPNGSCSRNTELRFRLSLAVRKYPP